MTSYTVRPRKIVTFEIFVAFENILHIKTVGSFVAKEHCFIQISGLENADDCHFFNLDKTASFVTLPVLHRSKENVGEQELFD